MNKSLALVLACAAILSPLAADDGATVYDRWPSSLGYSYNTEGGAGLSWQRCFGDFGLGLTAGGVYDEAGSWATYSPSMVVLDYNAQARLSWRLYAEDLNPFISSKLEAVAYLAHRGIIPMDYVGYDKDTFIDQYTRGTYLAEYMLGAGVSIELTAFEHLSQSYEFMYIAKWPLELAIAGGCCFKFRY